jgi:ATP-dependent Clp protease ATP-binding subunit ClpA
MINIGASLFSNFTLDRTQLWEKASTTLDRILYSPWTKWTVATGGVCLAGYAVSRARAPLVKLDDKLARAGENTVELMNIYKELAPIRGHWFYAKRWAALKAHLESHPNVMGPFCEAFLEHQISDPQSDWLSPACELVSFEQLSRIHGVDADALKKHAGDLAKALEYPPEQLETVNSTLVGYGKEAVAYVAQALHSFSTTFLRAHDFSSDENQSLVQRTEARWHLNNFYEIIEKPAMLIMTVYTFLQPKTKYGWVPYVGTFCAILATISLIKFFQVYLEKKKKPVLSHDFRNLSDDARQGKLPIPSDRADDVSTMINCFYPLDPNSLSILLVGPSGVGKDATVHAFVHELLKFQGDVDVHTANTSELKEFGGGNGHLYFSRIQILMRDLRGKEHRNILFMNEIHTLNPKKDQPNANPSELGQQIKTFIETGKLHVVGATTLKEYKDHIEWDDALDRRFVKIFLEQSSTCEEILESSLAEQYPTVTIEKDAITYALKETDKVSPDISQPAKAKAVLTEAARTVLGNYGEEEKQLVKESAELTKQRRALKRNPTNRAKAEEVAKLVAAYEKKDKAHKEKRRELQIVTDLKNGKVSAQEQLTRLAHRITAQPDKTDLEMKTFILVCRILDKTQKEIEVKEAELDRKGWRIKVTQNLIKEILDRKK